MTEAPSAPDFDDMIQPFKIEGQAIRGRFVRLGPLVHEILGRHDYPRVVAAMLAEMLALAATLAATLKYDGVFTLQTKGDGPIRLMVADITSGGDVRGYAQFDAERLAKLGDSPLSVPRLLGAGFLAFTVDQGSHTERYQGIVELIGATLVECMHHYFQQSEQFDAAIRVAVGAPRGDGEAWRASALMLQRLPPGAAAADEIDEGWRRALALMASGRNAEMLDANLGPHDLLYRLFHEDGVRVFTPSRLQAGCRCSRERVERVIRSLPAPEVEELKIGGKLSVTCEFCNSSYDFSEAELAALRPPDA
jgi:molecular chaperone Hsp33